MMIRAAIVALAMHLQVATPDPQVFRDYQSLHREPELGKKEQKTAAYIRSRLRDAGYLDFLPVNGLPTAVIAVLNTGKPGPTVCFRAELDGRPQAEESGLPYASQIANAMHSCGHDAHAAILLNAAQALSEEHSGLRGTIVFLFQPAEETPGGADDVVRDGLLKRLGVSSIFALHCAPGLPVGKFELYRGPVLAGSNYFSVVVHGRESHAATPQEGDDVLLAAAKLVRDLAELPARHVDSVHDPTVVSITCFSAGDSQARNVLPRQAVFEGTIRSFHPLAEGVEGRPPFEKILRERLERLSAVYHVESTLDLRRGAPVTVNSEALYDELMPQLKHALSDTLRQGDRYLFSEDFAYYTETLPALYFSLGIAKDGLGNEPVHTSRFSVHPDALQRGVAFWQALAGVTNRVP